MKWYWAYIMCLKSTRPAKALIFGSLMHEAWALWYPPGVKRGILPATSFKKLYTEYLRDGGEELFMKDDTDDRIDMGELGVHMMENYVEQWGDDEDLEIIQPELIFQVDVYDAKGKYLYTYVGAIDGVARKRSTGELIFLEHKTGAGLDPFGAPTELDEQSGSYWAFAHNYLWNEGIVPQGEYTTGVLFNRARKAFADTRPRNAEGQALNKPAKDVLFARCLELKLEPERKMVVADLCDLLEAEGENPLLLGEPSKSQPQPLFKREMITREPAALADLVRRASAEIKEMRLVRKGVLEVYKNPGKHCIYCEFRDMCEVHEAGGDFKSMERSLYKSWEPYAPHEIELEGKL